MLTNEKYDDKLNIYCTIMEKKKMPDTSVQCSTGFLTEWLLGKGKIKEKGYVYKWHELYRVIKMTFKDRTNRLR